MTFCLHKIKITNFRSYKGTHEFEFPTVPGIYFFTGENLVDDIGANGAGKSTFLDAIVWCLYGATSRGLKASDVLTDWETAGCVVELDLTVSSQRSLIKRAQKPNNLTLDGNPVDQGTLEAYLRLNHSAFLNSIFNSQFGASFFSLTSTVKLNLFSEIMNLDHWLKLSKEAAKQSAKLDEELNNFRNDISHVKGKIASTSEDLTALKQDESSFSKTIAAKRETLAKEYKLLQKEKDSLRHLISQLTDDHMRMKVDLSNAHFLVKRAEEIRDRKIAYIQSVSNKIAIEKDRLERIPKLEDCCPTCGARLSANKLADTQRNIRYHTEQISHMQADHATHIKALIKLRSQCETAVTEFNELQVEISEIDTAINEKTFGLKSIESRMTGLATQIKEAESEKNLYTVLRLKKAAQLDDLKRSLTTLKGDVALFEQRHEAVSFWIKGFKRIRLFIIEQAFQALELEVNNCLSQLGLHEWSITFDIERENRSGGLTKGFMVFVKSPRNKFPVKWENWSGGETQRLQLAGDIGLSNLIMHQAGLQNTIEFFDEPSTHLSQEGMLDLANMLHERALNEDKAIWIVDHAAIQNFGNFQGVIKVRKDNDGSSLSFTPP
jgi:DNA repair exonuclease SbcCD ATPase subunit